MKLTEKQVLALAALTHKKSNDQINLISESDAELLRVGNEILAISIDTIEEELTNNFFSPGFISGWIAALMSLSDLAAVGAKPLGILMSYCLPESTDLEELKELILGVEACARTHNTYVLGGDTNMTTSLSITCTALGQCLNGSYSTRKNIAPNQQLFITKNLGQGNLSAFLNSLQLPIADSFNQSFRPTISFELAHQIAQYKGACIDTSDGFFKGLHDLLCVNKIGAFINYNQLPYHPMVAKVSAEARLPKAIFAIGGVGDYGLLFSIPNELVAEFKANTNSELYHHIGHTTTTEKIIFETEVNSKTEVDIEEITEQISQVADPETYIKFLAGVAQKYHLS